jgi:photosystem II stability/assembly factor-like uncharacterized protein
MAIDPDNPNIIYAATWQRHRTVAAYLGGGPKSGLHKSVDGGKTWKRLVNGLPTSNMGKIGLAISPQDSDILYAAIELDQRKGGVYKSVNRGENWTKQSNAVSGATGPHYYQELYACPHNFDRIYLVDVRIQVSDDGGKTFRQLKEEHKHSDNHSINFKKSDPDYLLIGTDGGIYESLDLAENWRFIDNLPLTQFYKIAVDDAEPFYNIYGGTQDNSTQRGPVQTNNVQGIQNSDWTVVLNWDGHQPATEPGNPDIVYAERQEGALSRIDLKSGHVMDIQPQPAANEPAERFNWDAPILVSPHEAKRIYFASHRLWKSENRGDEWEAISEDLTKNQNRIELEIMDKKQSIDNPWDFLAMSNYNTITSISESPVKKDLIYVGTDDGLIQVTEDGGKNWRKIDISNLPEVPSTAFVNDIKADLFDENTVYVVLDNHKFGDFNPYVYKSMNRGKTWVAIHSTLPDRHLSWRIVQDHIEPNLLFLATEFGVFFTLDGGENWVKFTKGLPTISFRDLAIQRRENDLVAASFGRGLYVLDDYSVLRQIKDEVLEQPSVLLDVQDADWYIPRSKLGFDGMKGNQGASHFVAPNPTFGAVLSYYVKESPTTGKEERKKKEEALIKENQDIPFPGWDELAEEELESKPILWFFIRNSDGKLIRKIKGKNEAGIHRIAWDLKYPTTLSIPMNHQGIHAKNTPVGLYAPPGNYTAQMYKEADGQLSAVGNSIKFSLHPTYELSIQGAPMELVDEFWRAYETETGRYSAVTSAYQHSLRQLKVSRVAMMQAKDTNPGWTKTWNDLKNRLDLIGFNLNGNPVKARMGEKTKPMVGERLFKLSLGISLSSYGPTETHKQSLKIIQNEIDQYLNALQSIQSELEAFKLELSNAGAPYIEGDALRN